MDTEKKLKIGIMGGTFNPVHVGHLMLAQTALTQFQLEKIWFMPNRMPDYKSVDKLISTEHRLAMVQGAIEGNPSFELSTFELEREGYTYTYETLELLKKQYPNHQYYFIIGGDSLYAFSNWKYPERIVKNCILLAASRNNMSIEDMDKQIEYLNTRYQAHIKRLDCPNIEVSSAMLRSKIEKNESIRYFVPEKVYAYIEENHLYR